MSAISSWIPTLTPPIFHHLAGLIDSRVVNIASGASLLISGSYLASTCFKLRNSPPSDQIFIKRVGLDHKKVAAAALTALAVGSVFLTLGISDFYSSQPGRQVSQSPIATSSTSRQTADISCSAKINRIAELLMEGPKLYGSTGSISAYDITTVKRLMPNQVVNLNDYMCAIYKLLVDQKIYSFVSSRAGWWLLPDENSTVFNADGKINTNPYHMRLNYFTADGPIGDCSAQCPKLPAS